LGQVWPTENEAQAEKAGPPDKKPVVVQEVKPVEAEKAGWPLRDQEAWVESPTSNPAATVPDEEVLPVASFPCPNVPASAIASEGRRDEFETVSDGRWNAGALFSMLSLELLAFYRQGRTKRSSKSSLTLLNQDQEV
jgi:hypothetical protein